MYSCIVWCCFVINNSFISNTKSLNQFVLNLLNFNIIIFYHLLWQYFFFFYHHQPLSVLCLLYLLNNYCSQLSLFSMWLSYCMPWYFHFYLDCYINQLSKSHITQIISINHWNFRSILSPYFHQIYFQFHLSLDSVI